MSTAITLESNPIEKDYEEYICAYLQSGGLYVEKSIIHREVEEILELDVIINDFKEDCVSKKLIEIKSGGWGFSEIFKVKGWLVFLKLEDGVFIVKTIKDNFEYFQKKAIELNINLIDNHDLTQTYNSLEKFLCQKPEEKEIETLRFSYLLERKLLKQIKRLKRDYPDVQGYKNLDDYFFKINSGSFFSSNPVRRIKQLFDVYLKYKNLTAKLCYELENGVYSDEIEKLSKNGFGSLFYNAEDSPLHIALYIEHLARLTILKSCTEQLLREHKDVFGLDHFMESIDYLCIPRTIKTGLEQIVTDRYFHRYPIFWQFFTYVMGGFILTDLQQEEYQYISDNTGIPVTEIPNAFDSFNKLFPKAEGWMYKIPNSNIKWHLFFPVALSGVGANHRRFLHVKAEKEEDQTYEELEKMINGNRTISDLAKWNNLGHRILIS